MADGIDECFVTSPKLAYTRRPQRARALPSEDIGVRELALEK